MQQNVSWSKLLEENVTDATIWRQKDERNFLLEGSYWEKEDCDITMLTNVLFPFKRLSIIGTIIVLTAVLHKTAKTFLRSCILRSCIIIFVSCRGWLHGHIITSYEDFLTRIHTNTFKCEGAQT